MLYNQVNLESPRDEVAAEPVLHASEPSRDVVCSVAQGEPCAAPAFTEAGCDKDVENPFREEPDECRPPSSALSLSSSGSALSDSPLIAIKVHDEDFGTPARPACDSFADNILSANLVAGLSGCQPTQTEADSRTLTTEGSGRRLYYCFALAFLTFAALLLALALRKLGPLSDPGAALERLEKERWQWRSEDDPWWRPGVFVVDQLSTTTTTMSTAATGTATTSTTMYQPYSAQVKEQLQNASAVTFYMYRAQSDVEYPMENVNTADLGGVLWYLQNEVMVTCPRKYSIVRVKRLLVTLKQPYNPFVAFDKSMCTVPGCDAIWFTRGWNVGIQQIRLENECVGHWYSLPGICPEMPYPTKTAICNQTAPGGRCSNINDLSAGSSCTYYVEDAGEIRLDEVTGILERYPSYESFCRDGGMEYSRALDQGVSLHFWDGFNLAGLERRRQQFIKAFEEKYPDAPKDLPPPGHC